MRAVETLTYPAGRTYTLTTIMDAEGNILWYTHPSGAQVDMRYDSANRVNRVRYKPAGSTVWTTIVDTVTYRPGGPIASMLYGDGRTQTRTYETSYRLTRVLDTNGTVVLRDLSYGYALTDNMTSITDAQSALNNETFGYTPREHLASATGPYGSIGYTYDGVGNRTAQALNPGSGLLTDSYSYLTTNNRLQSVALGTGGTRSFTYDAAGNVTYDNRSGQGFGYTYDNAGRMASFSLNGILRGNAPPERFYSLEFQAEYVYNQLGQQIIRRLTWDRSDDPVGLWPGRQPDCGI